MWVGFDTPRTLGFNSTGGHTALPIWMQYMETAAPKSDDRPFATKGDIEWAQIDEKSGNQVTKGGRRYPFLRGRCREHRGGRRAGHPAGSRRPALIAGLAVLLLAGCDTTDTSTIHTCTIPATLSPLAGSVGSTVTATGQHFTKGYDTSVRVGGVTARVRDVTRTDCAVCDACIDAAGAIRADRASTACTASCTTCVQTMDFVVPTIDPGETTVSIENAYGASDPLAFTVTSGDTGSSDSGGTR